MPKVCALTAESLKFLTSLDSACKNIDVTKRSDLFILNEERRSQKSHITWVIEKSQLDKKKSYGDYLESPAIKMSTLIRKLILYPNGKDLFKWVSFVSLSVQFKDLPRNMHLEGDISVLGKDGDTVLSESFSGYTNDMKGIDVDNLFGCSKLSSYLVNNQLTIRCRINSISQIYKCKSGKSTYQVHHSPKVLNYERLMREIGWYSDVSLEMDSRMIKCHRFILASESQALSILFKSCDRNILDMNDKSPAVIEELLSFIYSGRIRLLKFGHICQLYIAADDFGVLNLKDICTVFLSSSLSEKNVPYIFELSMKYRDHYLIEACIMFVKANNIKSLKDTFMERSLKIKI